MLVRTRSLEAGARLAWLDPQGLDPALPTGIELDHARTNQGAMRLSLRAVAVRGTGSSSTAC